MIFMEKIKCKRKGTDISFDAFKRGGDVQVVFPNGLSILSFEQFNTEFEVVTDTTLTETKKV